MLFAELLHEENGWTSESLKKLAGLNLVRVWKKVEQVFTYYKFISKII